MTPDSNLHYFCSPRCEQPVGLPVEFLPVQELLADEPACRTLWELVGSQFRTRGKFLAVWPNVRYVAAHRADDGTVVGLLLVSSTISWQIDYVVVRPEARGRGVAGALVRAALNAALARGVPYVMLSSREELRPLYEGCGFTVVGAPELVA